MKVNYKDLNILLGLMLTSIDDIELFLDGVSQDQFLLDRQKRAACIMCLQTIGELCHKIEKEFPGFSAFEYRKIIRLRHIISHDYFGIDLLEIRVVCTKNIPGIKESIEEYLRL